MHRWAGRICLWLGFGAAAMAQQGGGAVAPTIQKYCAGCHSAAMKAGGLVLDPAQAEHAGQASRGVGEGGAQAASALHAADRNAAAGRAHLRGDRGVADRVAGSRGGGEARSRPHRYLPAAESHRISQRDSRSAGAGCGCARAAAQRRREPRLRQRDGGRAFADAAGALCGARRRRSAGWRWGARARRPAATPSICRRTSRRRSTSTICRWARAAAWRCATPSRSMPSTRSRCGCTRDRNEHVEGLNGAHEVEMMLDGERAGAVHREAAAGQRRSSPGGSAT